MKNAKLSLSVLPETFAVCRLENNAKIPNWANSPVFCSITKTREELSIVCDQSIIPQDTKNIKIERDWTAFKVEGPLDFALTGILSSLAKPLAEAAISIFAISTFDTDYILTKSTDTAQAIQVLGKFCTINHQI